MKFILLSIWTIFCIVAGDWILRKGVSYQVNGTKYGKRLQILALVVTLGLPLLVALIVNRG